MKKRGWKRQKGRYNVREVENETYNITRNRLREKEREDRDRKRVMTL